MSLDNNSVCVTSKYFSRQSAMDESLSDFQEAKKSCKGPKPAPKPSKPKTRKVTKRIKGQKDIRTALKGKKNELVSYSEEFDTVCKKSGLDIDSDQLQLAIALSKSLQTESTSNPENSQALSSQQRVARIRKTLQEYGFKVPEAKIINNKRTKKVRKHYKLLTISEEEKHQNITKKYSQIIFENLDDSRLGQNNSDNHDANARVFFIATNIPYESMKDNNVFYVENLIEKSTTSGLLLRDWSEIPGRPVSPKLFNTDTMNFKDIDCSQDELDVVLSGSFKSVKSIIATKEIEYKNKYREYDVPKIVIGDVDGESVIIENKILENKSPLQIKTPVKQDIEMKSPFKADYVIKSPVSKELVLKSPVKVLPPNNEVVEIKSPIKEVLVNRKLFDGVTGEEINNKLTTCTQQYRSCSPDIFDEDFSSIMDNTKPVDVLSQEHKTKVFIDDNFMDLTQCANGLSQNTKYSQLSQNITKRKSNDFMEITECIVGSSQPIREEINEIDLTQTPEDKVAIIEENQSNKNNNENLGLSIVNVVEQNSNAGISQNITDEHTETVLIKHPEPNDNIDLTQSSNEDDNIITVIDENNQTPNKIFDDMDLTQSSNSTDIDDLPVVDVANSQTQKSLDDTIIINKEEYIANGKFKKSLILETDAHNIFDLTQAEDDSKEYNSSSIEKSKESCSASFYEDFEHDHSETTENTENEQENKHSTISKESNNIDLTQASDTSEERIMSPRPVTVYENIPNNSSLGKRDNVSIDYDEILIDDNNIIENVSKTSKSLDSDKITNDNINLNQSLGKILDEYNIENEKHKESEKKNNSLDLKYDLIEPEGYNDVEIVYTSDGDIKSSQNSEAFNISDKELDYSLHKSRYDYPRNNFDFGGISVLDNVTKLGSFRKSLTEECSIATNQNIKMGDSYLPEVNIKETDDKFRHTLLMDTQNPAASNPIKVHEIFNSNNGIVNIKTPKNTEYVIKTDNVTPMADYASMTTPQRNRELDRYGLKPFKRKRAVQILTHLYNQTHPTIKQLVDEDQPSPSKKLRQEPNIQHSSPKKLINSPKPSPLKETPVKSYERSPLHWHETDIHPSPRKPEELKRDSDNLCALSPKKTEVLKRDGDSSCAPSPKKTDGMKDVYCYEVTNEVAVIRSVDCSPNDWVFQKREKAKVHSCRVPLHIAFHNYVLSRRSLRETILKYEPVNIDVIHKDLIGYGHRYDPKDLLSFLDKKCITVKTTDNNSRNKKR